MYPEELRAAGEDAPVAPLPEDTEEVRYDTYGPLKALAEAVVRQRFPEAFIPRPGLIAGPWDPTGRFTYWPLRFCDEGPVLAPSPPETAVQVIDPRDLATWIVAAAETGLAGTYNAIAPPVTMEQVLDSCRRAANSDPEIMWVDGQFLIEHGVQPWGELPLWTGPDDPDLMRTPVEKALQAGLKLRPLDETTMDTLAWAREHPAAQPTTTLTRAKEQTVLADWNRLRSE